MKMSYAKETLSILLLLIAGCGADKSEDGSPPSPVVGTWLQTMEESREGTAAWAPVDDIDCRTDNVEEYADDGSWTLYDGTARCSASGTGILHGTWRLTANDTKVVYTYEGAGGEYESTIELMSDTDLILTHATGTLSGTQIRSTFEKQ